MQYFEMLSECPFYEHFINMWKARERWSDPAAIEAINNLIGVDVSDTLGICETRLYLSEIPDKFKHSFRKYGKRDPFYAADEDSWINQQYVLLCKEFGLKTENPLNLAIGIGLRVAFRSCQEGMSLRYMFYYRRNRCLIETEGGFWKMPSGIREMQAEDFFAVRDAVPIQRKKHKNQVSF